MPLSSCCVPFCSSGYRRTRKENREQNIQNPSMFRMPKDPVKFRKWEKKIDRKDRKLTLKDSVCALHFQPEFIVRTYPKLKMPDGSIFEMERERVILRKDAVPSIFPNYPAYKSIPIPPARKPPKRRSVSDPDGYVAPSKRKKIKNGWPGWNILPVPQISSLEGDPTHEERERGAIETEETENPMLEPKELGYEDFVSILQKKSPNNWDVLISQHTRCIALFQFDPSNFQVKKRITITETLSVLVFFGVTSVQLNPGKLCTQENLFAFIDTVDQMEICPGNSPTCQGYIPGKSKKCVRCYEFNPRTNKCNNCGPLRKRKEFFRRKYLNLLKKKFFGMVRSCGGCNDHPDPVAFLLTFRLMCVYSLIRPSGSNVTGEELFESLLKNCDTSSMSNDMERWEKLRNRIISNIEADSTETVILNAKSDEDRVLLEFFGGYIAMKTIAKQRCDGCTATLITQNCDEDSITFSGSLIDMRNYHNVLHYPSNALQKLVSWLEDRVQEEISIKNVSSLSPDTFFNIADKLTSSTPYIDLIGCSQHRSDILTYVVQFFLILRMQFICKDFNDSLKNACKPREMRKMGKLIQGNA